MLVNDIHLILPYPKVLLCCSGFDVLGLLQAIGVSDSIIAPLKDSSMGYVAFAIALYKLATPLRYAVTVGNNNTQFVILI